MYRIGVHFPTVAGCHACTVWVPGVLTRPGGVRCYADSGYMGGYAGADRQPAVAGRKVPDVWRRQGKKDGLEVVQLQVVVAELVPEAALLEALFSLATLGRQALLL